MSQASPVLASTWHYPLLNVFWTMLMLFLWIAWFFLLFKIITDVFRSRDLSGGVKAGWTIFLILVPFLAAFIYLIARGEEMHWRDRDAAASADEAMQNYVKSVSGDGTSTADELTKLADLHQSGVLSQSEFDAQKAKLLA